MANCVAELPATVLPLGPYYPNASTDGEERHCGRPVWHVDRQIDTRDFASSSKSAGGRGNIENGAVRNDGDKLWIRDAPKKPNICRRRYEHSIDQMARGRATEHFPGSVASDETRNNRSWKSLLNDPNLARHQDAVQYERERKDAQHDEHSGDAARCLPRRLGHEKRGHDSREEDQSGEPIERDSRVELHLFTLPLKPPLSLTRAAITCGTANAIHRCVVACTSDARPMMKQAASPRRARPHHFKGLAGHESTGASLERALLPSR
jgi:hypothetical protein